MKKRKYIFTDNDFRLCSFVFCIVISILVFLGQFEIGRLLGGILMLYVAVDTLQIYFQKRRKHQ